MRWTAIMSAIGIGIGMTFGRSMPYAALKVGLASYWKLGEATGQPRLDSSPNGNTLTNNNNCTQVAGKIGNATGFASASTQFLSTAAGLYKAFPFSVAGWVNPTNTAIFGTVCGNTDNAGGPIFTLQVTQNTGLVRISFDQNLGGGAHFRSSATNIGLGSWSHLAVTFDGTTLNLYINGTLDVNSGAYSFATAVSSTPFGVIGATSSVGAGPFNGSIDAVGVWSRVLSVADINSLYNGGAGVEIY